MAVYDLLIVAGALGLSLALFVYLRPSSSLPLPPGPKPVPILGNALQMPKSEGWLTFQKWGEEYGNVCSVTVLGRTIIILNSLKALSDIFEKKAASSSARPYSVMISKLIGLGRGPSFTNDMELHKKYRKLFAQALNSRASSQYLPFQMLESRKMMYRLLDSPQTLRANIKRYVVTVTFLITYGYQLEKKDDYFGTLANNVMDNFIKDPSSGFLLLVRPLRFVFAYFIANGSFQAGPPPPYLVDYIPILRFVPAWFPGADFQKKVVVWRAQWMDLLHKPFDLVEAEMAAGTARPSFTSNLLEEGGKVTGEVDKKDLIMWSSGTFYLAGSDTTLASIHSFFLAMMMYPEVQAKAQAELDEVVGSDRMPSYEDRDRLVYCTAVMKETLRWHSVAPTGVPRTVTQDEEYKGYRIPKGSMILPNLYAIMHDPVVYPKPYDFIPERFLSPDGKSLQSPEGARDFCAAVFSLGRRVCPGSHLAENSIFMAVVNTLWTFNISKPVGPDGRPIELKPEFTSGIVCHPKEFPCDIKPRSPQRAEIVRGTVADEIHPDDKAP